MQKLLRLTILLVLALTVLTACSSAGNGKTVPVTIVMGENNQMTFSPKDFSVEKGTTVELTLVNKDTAVSHSYLIPALNVKTEAVPPGQTASTKFTAGRTGTFETLCDVPGHKAQGMVGTLTVK